MATIPADFEDLFERTTFGIVGTLLPDGSPHLTPIWPDYDGEHVLVNTERGRQKERNVRGDPSVGLCILDPDDPYRFISITGEVVEVTEDGAEEHVDRLARQYWDVDGHAERAGEGGPPRVLIKIRPDRIMSSATSKSGGE
ncbi:MAG: PPOX class F420-dependent oxidoreductase [Halorhabdus sp.]